jgi:hypothetical protein
MISISGGISDSTLVTPCSCGRTARRRSNFGLACLGPKRLDDAMTRQCLGADVGHVLQGFLAAACRAPNALTDSRERIHHQRRAGKAQQRQAGIHVDQHGRIADDRQRLARQVANGFRDGELHLRHVVGQAREEPPRGLTGKVRGRLVQDVAKERPAQVVHDPLPHLGHPDGGQIRHDP